jgi:hypothetical protein
VAILLVGDAPQRQAGQVLQLVVTPVDVEGQGLPGAPGEDLAEGAAGGTEGTAPGGHQTAEVGRPGVEARGARDLGEGPLGLGQGPALVVQPAAQVGLLGAAVGGQAASGGQPLQQRQQPGDLSGLQRHVHQRPVRGHEVGRSGAAPRRPQQVALGRLEGPAAQQRPPQHQLGLLVGRGVPEGQIAGGLQHREQRRGRGPAIAAHQVILRLGQDDPQPFCRGLLGGQAARALELRQVAGQWVRGLIRGGGDARGGPPGQDQDQGHVQGSPTSRARREHRHIL